MELIKLSIDLGLEVIKQLKEKGYEPRTNKLGIYSLEFTQEELNQITKLELCNLKLNSLRGIENFKNLEYLSIDSDYSAYNDHNAGISDNDIKSISKIKSLKHLSIKNQSNISWICLYELDKLEELYIERNNRIDTITGLEKLKSLNEVSIYGNKELYKIDNLRDLILDNNLDLLELDLLNYPELDELELRQKLINIINCRFNETVSNGKIISYNYGTATIFHKKSLEVCQEIARKTKNPLEIITLVDEWIAKNITYDNDALNRKERYHTENDKKIGLNNGTQSAYNGIMFGSCVCEGYTRVMQYLLKIFNIQTKNVYCISGKDKIKVNENCHNKIELPDDGYHSIIGVEYNDGIYYCDPCWDSCRWHRGDQTLPYCLRTKGEISEDHTLSFEETNTLDNPAFHIPKETIQNIIMKYNEEEYKKNGHKR